jgi:hypothetical protein
MLREDKAAVLEIIKLKNDEKIGVQFLSNLHRDLYDNPFGESYLNQERIRFFESMVSAEMEYFEHGAQQPFSQETITRTLIWNLFNCPEYKILTRDLIKNALSPHLPELNDMELHPRR